ncbi:MAG: deoxyhypusine synthase family protein [Deltaproteobacteria bacterium]|nr:deoxyhypusine synthase family protein [Deltaproteobacteria bacterium]
MKNIELDKRKLTTYPLASRPSKVSLDHCARKLNGKESVADLLNKLPGFLAADDLRSVINAIITAHRRQCPILLGMGAHVIKVGLTPLILQLVEKRIISGIALNGAGIIHDFELAYAGHTSEDVTESISAGNFGMAQETGALLNRAILLGDREGLGLGAAVGRMIWEEKLPHREMSLLGQCYRMQVPVTVHVAMGTDIIHMHAAADGAAIGRTSFRDFDRFCNLVAQLEDGVYINLGSAVVLPEVFLKAISLVRNLGHPVQNLTTVNMDFNRHYRSFENVVKRPTLNSGRGYQLIGHHEIMFPLLAAAILARLEE